MDSHTTCAITSLLEATFIAVPPPPTTTTACASSSPSLLLPSLPALQQSSLPPLPLLLPCQGCFDYIGDAKRAHELRRGMHIIARVRRKEAIKRRKYEHLATGAKETCVVHATISIRIRDNDTTGSKDSKITHAADSSQQHSCQQQHRGIYRIEEIKVLSEKWGHHYYRISARCRGTGIIHRTSYMYLYISLRHLICSLISADLYIYICLYLSSYRLFPSDVSLINWR
jgi:hypothetical protein